MQFLQAHGLDPAGLDAESLLRTLRYSMAQGLAGQGALPMLPAPFALSEVSPRNCTIPAFDVGGTNVRSARVSFDAQGNPTLQQMRRGVMPGTQVEVDETAFYDALCSVLMPNISPGESVGYCFSYPVDSEGRLLFWTKGIQAPTIVGRDVARDLEAALTARGCANCTACVLNDTVAALLAAYAHDVATPYAGYVGFILGTGMNAAYAERSDGIPKMPGLPSGRFIPINCEAGNFTDFPRSSFDDRYEVRSGNGRAQWERCISGVHLGALGTEILHCAAEEGLFSPALREQILGRSFTTVELDAFCSGKQPELLTCSSEEADVIVACIRPMYQRAALFAAVTIVAAGLASAEARGASSGVIRVNADGSTFWKTSNIPFVDLVKAHLDALLSPRGFTYELVQIEEAPLVGAALAVL